MRLISDTITPGLGLGPLIIILLDVWDLRCEQVSVLMH